MEPNELPQGPLADFAAELHERTQTLLMDLPFALTPPQSSIDYEPTEIQQAFTFTEEPE